jgi:hypothetical protein
MLFKTAEIVLLFDVRFLCGRDYCSDCSGGLLDMSFNFENRRGQNGWQNE